MLIFISLYGSLSSILLSQYQKLSLLWKEENLDVENVVCTIAGFMLPMNGDAWIVPLRHLCWWSWFCFLFSDAALQRATPSSELCVHLFTLCFFQPSNMGSISDSLCAIRLWVFTLLACWVCVSWRVSSVASHTMKFICQLDRSGLFSHTLSSYWGQHPPTLSSSSYIIWTFCSHKSQYNIFKCVAEVMFLWCLIQKSMVRSYPVYCESIGWLLGGC